MRKKTMLKRSVCFPLDDRAEVRRIQRTYKNTWTMLIKKPVKNKGHSILYINHTEADGTEIQVYPLNFQSFCFELVNENKIFVPF